VYASTILLFLSLVMFLGRVGALWVIMTAGLAILMAILAFVIALRSPR